jgi:hypothetical protein
MESLKPIVNLELKYISPGLITFKLKSLYLLVHKLHICTHSALSGIRPHCAPNPRPIVFSSNVYYVSRAAQLLSDWEWISAVAGTSQMDPET